MSKKQKRISTDGGSGFGDNPFGALDGAGLPNGPSRPVGKSAPKAEPKKLGRIEIRREKAGRGGKTVTTIAGDGLQKHCPAELERLAKALKNRCASGGALKGKVIEVQGDHRETAKSYFEKEGYRVVFAGG